MESQDFAKVSRSSALSPDRYALRSMHRYHHTVIQNATPFRDFTGRCKSGDTYIVDIQEVRRKQLRKWIDGHHDEVVSRFAVAVRKQQSQIADMLDGRKSFGERVARDLEERADMPVGYLDAAGAAAETHRETLWNVNLSREEAEVGREWGKLAEPLRSTMRQQIELLVAAAERDSRSKKRDSKTKRPRSGDSPGAGHA